MLGWEYSKGGCDVCVFESIVVVFSLLVLGMFGVWYSLDVVILFIF